MRYYWLHDWGIEQKQIHVYWKGGNTNLGDYMKKHFPAKHHIAIQPTYVSNNTIQKQLVGALSTV